MQTSNKINRAVLILLIILFACNYVPGQVSLQSPDLCSGMLDLKEKHKDPGKIQIFSGFGVSVGSAYDYGWSHPDPYLSEAYRELSSHTVALGVHADFLKLKNLSTMIQLTFKQRTYSFSYDMLNGGNEVTGTGFSDNRLTLLSLVVSEKYSFDLKDISVYLYTGIRGDYYYNKSIDADFQKVFNRSSGFGLRAGIGYDSHLTDDIDISMDLFIDPDLTNIYKSNYGGIRNTEIGYTIGAGYRFK